MSTAYRRYIIEQHYKDGQPDSWTFAHEDYDGAPYSVGEGPADRRSGFSPTLADAKADIDELVEDEATQIDCPALGCRGDIADLVERSVAARRCGCGGKIVTTWYRCLMPECQREWEEQTIEQPGEDIEEKGYKGYRCQTHEHGRCFTVACSCFCHER